MINSLLRILSAFLVTIAPYCLLSENSKSVESLKNLAQSAFKSPDSIFVSISELGDSEKSYVEILLIRMAFADNPWRFNNKNAYTRLIESVQSSKFTAQHFDGMLKEVMSPGNGRTRELMFLIASEINTPAVAEIVGKYLNDDQSFHEPTAVGKLDPLASEAVFPHAFEPYNSFLAAKSLGMMTCIEGPKLNVPPSSYTRSEIEQWRSWWSSHHKIANNRTPSEGSVGSSGVKAESESQHLNASEGSTNGANANPGLSQGLLLLLGLILSVILALKVRKCLRSRENNNF